MRRTCRPPTEATAREPACPECRQPLSILPDCRPLLLRCARQHYSTVRMLLARWLPERGIYPPAVLSEWEERARWMLGLGRRAFLQESFLDVDGLLEAAEQIEDRVHLLRSRQRRSALARAESGT